MVEGRIERSTKVEKSYFRIITKLFTMRPDTVITVDPQGGETLSMAGGNYRILIPGEQTGKSFSVIEMLVPPGGGPGPHAHAAFQESFYVVDGEIVVRSETQQYVAKKGAFVSIPKGGAVHSFKNEGNENALLICIVVASGLEEFFREVGKPAAYGEILPAPPVTPEFGQKLKAAGEKYGQVIFPPDYLDKQK